MTFLLERFIYNVIVNLSHDLSYEKKLLEVAPQLWPEQHLSQK